MVKKFKLYSIGNNENFNYYIFDKKQEVIVAVSNLLTDLLQTTPLQFSYEHKDKKGNWKMKKINYEKKKDWHEHCSGDKGRADIYFGDRKIFVTLICSNKLRLKFNEALEDITYMPKPKKSKW